MNRDVLLYRERARQGETEKTNRDRDRETMSLWQPLTQAPRIQGFWFPRPPKKVWVHQMLTTSKTREANISVALCFIIFSLYFLFKIKLGFILWSRLRWVWYHDYDISYAIYNCQGNASSWVKNPVLGSCLFLGTSVLFGQVYWGGSRSARRWAGLSLGCWL